MTSQHTNTVVMAAGMTWVQYTVSYYSRKVLRYEPGNREGKGEGHNMLGKSSIVV